MYNYLELVKATLCKSLHGGGSPEVEGATFLDTLELDAAAEATVDRAL